MVRIDLENRLRDVAEPAMFGKHPLEPAVGTAICRDEASALSARRSEARTPATTFSSVCCMKASSVATSAVGASAAGAAAPSASGMVLMSAAPWVHRFERLTIEAERGRDPEGIDRIGQQQDLDAAGAKAFELRARARRLRSSPRR